MGKKELEPVKFESIVDARKRVARARTKKVARAAQDVGRVLKIMIFLPFASNFRSILRLYGMDDSSGIERRATEKGDPFSQ